MKLATVLIIGGCLAMSASGQVSPEDRARKAAAYKKANPPRDSFGLTPLTELGKGSYKGEQGGLYPGGENAVPKAHQEAGLKLAREIVPRDGEGKPSKDGKIVLISIGFSNPSIESSAFKIAADADPEKNPNLVVINGCVGSRAAPQIADPATDYWPTVDQRIKQAGVTAQQVQAIWMKQVIPGANGFPDLAKKLQGYLVDSLHIAKDRFPNLKIAYLSSRIYGGYTELGGSPEPGAYESGFAVKWAIGDQIAGKPELNYDPAKGKVRAPWIAWGPYWWADGVKARKDGLFWVRADYREDGLHPSDAGTVKTNRMLMEFLKTDPTAKGWFRK